MLARAQASGGGRAPQVQASRHQHSVARPSYEDVLSGLITFKVSAAAGPACRVTAPGLSLLPWPPSQTRADGRGWRDAFENMPIYLEVRSFPI